MYSSNVSVVSCSKNLRFLAGSRQLLVESNCFTDFIILLPLLDVQPRNVINVAKPQWNDSKQSQRQWPNIASKSELSSDHKRSKVKVKCKWSASRSLYYHNSTASFNILLCGDVPPQPGPNLSMASKPKKKTSRESIKPISKRQTVKCRDCEKTIGKNQQSVQCTICFDIRHAQCAGLKAVLHTCDWTCSKCLVSVLPFHYCTVEDMLEDEPTLTCLTLQETTDHIIKILQDQSKNLRIMHVNTQSVVSTFNEFLLMTETYPMDVITMSETWLKNNSVLLEYVTIPGYTTVFMNRSIKGGGVGAYIPASIPFKHRKDMNTCG